MESNWRATAFNFQFSVAGTRLAARFLEEPSFCLALHPVGGGTDLVMWYMPDPSQLAFALQSIPKITPHFPCGYGGLLEPD